MDPIQEQLEKEVAAAIGRSKTAQGAFRALPPQVREIVAEWIESRYKKYPLTIAKAQAYLADHPEDTTVRNNIMYWQVSIAVAKHLAYIARTTKGPRSGTAVVPRLD